MKHAIAPAWMYLDPYLIIDRLLARFGREVMARP